MSPVRSRNWLMRHPALGTGERCPRAGVDAMAESDVLARVRPVDVELVG